MAEHVYREWQGKWMGPSAIAKIAAAFVVVGLLALAGFSSYYTVAPDEEAVVLRFGAYHATTPPGLHFRLPLGVDRVEKVPVNKVRKLEFGFQTDKIGVRTEYAVETPENEETKLMLTGDLAIASVEWVVQYKIKDAKDWVFNVRSQDDTIRDLSEAAMRTVVGDHTITEVLTEKKNEIADAARLRLQERCDQYGLGVNILSVLLQNVNPPGPVQASFNDVNAAQQERSRLENEALQEYNKVVPMAKGQAKGTISEAEGYAVDRVNRAKGDVARFTELLGAYREAEEVTRQRLYLEAVQEVLPKVRRIVVAEGGDVLKLLPIEGGGK